MLFRNSGRDALAGSALIHVSWGWTIHFQDGLFPPGPVPWCSLESVPLPPTRQHILQASPSDLDFSQHGALRGVRLLYMAAGFS